jgi:O-antigen/teichoic acid export membrane protein
MKARVLALFRDDFIRHNAVFFVGSMTVAVLNYLYHPIISRLLTIQQFGEVQAFLSLSAQFGVIAGVFGMIILNLRANQTDEDAAKGEQTVRELYSLSLIIMGLVSVGLLLIAPYLSRTLELTSYAGFFIIAGSILLGTPRTFAKFHLQANKRFAQMSISEIIISGGKIAIAAALIMSGLHVAGALGGFLLATLAGLIYVYPRTRATISPLSLPRPRFTRALARELKYGGLILIATSFTTFLTVADILVVRYFFDAETAGLYAGIATVARIIVFATGSVAGVTIAHIALKKSRAENHATMKKSLLLVGLIAGGGLAVFALIPSLIVSLLMGGRFLPLADLLPLLSLLMALVAITNLFVMYFLALRVYALVGIAFLGASSIAVSTFIWHDTVAHVVWGFIGGIMLTLLLQCLLYIRK